MLVGIRKTLMGASTETPALNDLAKLVAVELPTDEVSCHDLATTLMDVAFSVKRDCRGYTAKYPNLCNFIKQGGDMCALSARMTEIVDAGITAKYADNYRVISKLYFG